MQMRVKHQQRGAMCFWRAGALAPRLGIMLNRGANAPRSPRISFVDRGIEPDRMHSHGRAERRYLELQDIHAVY